MCQESIIVYKLTHRAFIRDNVAECIKSYIHAIFFIIIKLTLFLYVLFFLDLIETHLKYKWMSIIQ